jgi:hypothetical protein
MSFAGAYRFLTKQAAQWQTPCVITLSACHVRKSISSKRGSVMDIERINQIGTRLADLTQRTEALRGYL